MQRQEDFNRCILCGAITPWKLEFRQSSFNRTDRVERWMYLAGEFGGGSWAIERANGADDTVTLSDYRIIFGVESKYYNGPTWLFEAGYVFNREVEYESGIGDFNPDETMMVRFGYTY